MMRTGKISTGFGGRLIRIGLTAAVLCASAIWCAAQHTPVSHGGGFAMAQSHSGASAPQPQSRPKPSPAIPMRSPQTANPGAQSGTQPGARPDFQPGRSGSATGLQPVRPNYQTRQGMQPERPNYQPGARPAGQPGYRPGAGHLPDWWQAHHGLSPNQQADALRREPGFRSLPADQQQRLINRLHSFDQRPPVEQQRMMNRNEMFERLPPERQQEVRGAAQALGRMPPDRQAMIRHAFQQLRGMPPDERQRMLSSAYASQFSPQERTVLGNMLSIEPYQPRVYQPYFGR